jgi:hypothetical protein
MQTLFLKGKELEINNIKEKQKFKYLFIPVLIFYLGFSFPELLLFFKLSFNNLFVILMTFIIYETISFVLFLPLYKNLKNKGYFHLNKSHRLIFSIWIIFPLLINNIYRLFFESDIVFTGFVLSLGIIFSIIFTFQLVYFCSLRFLSIIIS